MVDSYLQLGSQYALLVLVGLVVSVLMLGVWYRLANYVGKKFVLGLSAFFYGLGATIIGFVEPGQSGLSILFLVMVLVYISAMPAVAPAILAETIDYSTWKFGVDRSGTYFAFFTFVLKIGGAIGGFLSLWIAGKYGFDPAATEHTDQSLFGLHLAACWLPASLMLSSLVVFSVMPINTYQYRIIRRRLDARRLRDAKVADADLANNPSLKTLEPIVN